MRRGCSGFAGVGVLGPLQAGWADVGERDLMCRACLLNIFPCRGSRERGPCKDQSWKVIIWTRPLARFREKLAQINKVPQRNSHTWRRKSHRDPCKYIKWHCLLFVPGRKRHKSQAHAAALHNRIHHCKRYTPQTAHQQRGPRANLTFPKVLAPEGEHNSGSTSLAICPCKCSVRFSPFIHLLALEAMGNIFQGFLQPNLAESYLFLPKSWIATTANWRIGLSVISLKKIIR